MNCYICGRENAEKHHIVFKSQGGLDIEVNYIWLCYEHHRGNNGPHMSHKIDLSYKKEVQRQLYELFKEGETYQIKEIAAKIHYNKKRLENKFKDVFNHCGEYKTEDIIRKLMGGKLY